MKLSKKTVTWIDLFLHLFTTVLLAGYFYAKAQKPAWFFLCIAGGIFIDIDHFYDYFRCFGKKFSVNDFLYRISSVSGKAYVFFHSWELLGLLWVSALKVSWIIPLAAGMTVHVIVDQLMHWKTPFFYFLLFRARHDFSLKRMGHENNG